MEATVGRAGGYRLRRGYKLPPLMLTDDEAVATTLGLLVVDRLGLDGSVAAASGALAKLRRVLPGLVRERVRALGETLVVDLALDVRIFQLDRIAAAVLLAESFVRPSGFDSRAHLLESIARIPHVWDVSVLLALDLGEAQRLVPAGLALLESEEPYVRLRASIDDLEMIARVLASLGCPLIVERPEQLRVALRALADRL